MDRNFRRFILKVLNIINYTNDKNKFADKFCEICNAQVLDTLSARLPQDKRDSLKAQLSTNINRNVLTDFFTEKEIGETFRKAQEGMIREYIETILPFLSVTKKEELQTFFSSIK